MLTWIAAVALAQELPELDAKPDPVLEYAQLDLRTTRKARLGLVMATIGAPMAAAGGLGMFTYNRRTTTVGKGLSASMAAGGVIAFLAGPPLLASHSLRARKSLHSQGLEVSPIPGALTWGLYAAALVVPAATPSVAGFAIAGGLYTGCVLTGALQLRLNHLARRDAGWLAGFQPLPWTDGRSAGLAVAW